MISYVEHIFMYFMAIWMSSLEKHHCRSFAHGIFFFFFFAVELSEFLIYSSINSLSDTQFANISSCRIDYLSPCSLCCEELFHLI